MKTATPILVAFALLVDCSPASRMTLEWDANPEADVVGYHVYRSDQAGCCYTKVTPEPVREPKYIDTQVESGKQYYYRVTAVNAGGQESGFSEEIAGTAKPR